MLQQRAALIGLGDMRTWFVNRFRPHPRNTTAIQRVTSLVAPFYSLVQASKLAAYEQWLLHTYNHVVVVSEDDRQALRRLFESPHLSVVPNGVDVRYFSPETASLSKEQRDSPPLLVFTGTLDFRPNVDAVMWFASHVLPTIRFRYPGARFVVVGRSPAPAVRDLHDGTSIEVIGDVDDVRPFIALADVYVVPMRIGGGVRLKVLEALAMQAPLVSTTLGAEGIPELREDEHLLLADTPDDFAGAILRLLGNPAEGQRMGETGRALVSTFYDWQVVVPQFDAIYNQTNGFC
jgi:glycosyltransferase involved in cell wall biosynthesis